MTKQDNKFFWIIASFVIFLIILPYSIAFGIQLFSSYHYTGVNLMAGSDKTVYLSYMEQARQGKWLFKNLYTTEPQTAKLFSPLWLILGKLAYLTNLPNTLIFHFFRIIFAFCFLFLIYNFLKNYFFNDLKKNIIFTLLLISSGIGIWRLLGLILSNNFDTNEISFFLESGTDIWIAEANTFLTLLHSPLFILSQLIILGIFWLFLKEINNFSFKKSLIFFFLTLFIGIFHTYDLIIIDAVLGVFLVIYYLFKKKIYWRPLLNYLVIILASTLSLLYFYLIVEKEFALKGWINQNFTLAPPFFDFIIGYGFIFLFFLIGLIPVLRQRKNIYFLFILIWAVVQITLLYAPVTFQTKLSNGLHLPLCIIAGLGFFELLEQVLQYFKKNSIFIIEIIVFFLIATNIFILMIEISNNISKTLPFYLNQYQYQAALWLKNNMKEDEAVITADKDLGNILPSITGKLVYLGHGHQTINWVQKLVYLHWLYKNNRDDINKKNWLTKDKINYIFFEIKEYEPGDYQPGEKSYLENVYQNQEVIIFKVK